VSADPRVGDLLRELAPQVLGTLVRRHGQFDACEDAVQGPCSPRRCSGHGRVFPAARDRGW
jgi:predicted RNA polymerase sigma factor